MDINGTTAALIAAAMTLVGGVIGHVTALATADTTKDKELRLKEMELQNSIELSQAKQEHEISINQQEFVRDVIQKTIEKGSVEEQIKNLRSYAKIGLVGAPYAERILKLDEQELPSIQTGKTTSLESSNLPPHFFADILSLSKKVGRIDVGGHSVATGFIVGNGLLVTADFNLKDREIAANSTFTLNYETDKDGKIRKPEVFKLEADKVFINEPTIGFAVVALARSSSTGTPVEEFGSISASSPVKPQIGQQINAIHHFQGAPKKILIRGGEVVQVLEDEVLYLAAIGPGASGAPILNDNLDVVAIHRRRAIEINNTASLGSERKNSDWMARGGARWDRVLEDLTDKMKTINPSESSFLQRALGSN